MSTTNKQVTFLSSKTTIFDEFEYNFSNVLSRNECGNSEKCTAALDYLSSSNADFFLPAPEDNLHGEPQLYSVEQGELQPITSPFMVPGIYRKIDTSARAVPFIHIKPSNVFLTTSEPHGRIMRSRDFQKLYVCEDELKDKLNNNGQLRRVFPKNDVEHCNEAADESVAATVRSGSSKKVKWDALSKLACNILKLPNCDYSVAINRSRNEIVRTEKKSLQKTIYRLLSNEELGVEAPEKNNDSLTETLVQKPKLGRPKKLMVEHNSDDANGISRKVKMSASSVGRVKETDINENPIESKSISKRSRFGRIIKPIRPLPSRKIVEERKVYNSTEEIHELITDLKDKDFTCNLKLDQKTVPLPVNLYNNQEEQTLFPIATSSPTKRHVPPESICPTCKKIFLGRRLKRHFVDHPDHMKSDGQNTINQSPNTPTEEFSLFRFLVSKLQKSNLNEDQRADLFLHELNDLVEQLQLRSSRLIRNTSGLHLVTARIARVLGLPEGQYALDMTAIDATPEPEPACLLNYEVNALPVPSNNTRSLDYTALSLDDTLTDEAAQKLNLSAGGKLLPPSEESLLRAVDDLVPPTSITKLVVSSNRISQSVGVTATASSSSTVPHYDHASDNAVEAVTMKECNTGRQTQPMLDLAVDFFQFNTKK